MVLHDYYSTAYGVSRCSPNHFERIKAFLKEQFADDHFMVMSGGHFMVIMIAEEVEMTLFRIAFGISAKEYRGSGDWSRVKYNDANGNRIK